MLDGRQLGIAPIDRIVDVEPGPHRLEASRSGYVPFRARVDVQEGALSAAYVDMRPLTRVRAGSAPRLWTWIAAGSERGGAADGRRLSARVALAQRDDGDAAQRERWMRASDIALGSALTLAIGATLLYFIEAIAREHASTSHEMADARR